MATQAESVVGHGADAPTFRLMAVMALELWDLGPWRPAPADTAGGELRRRTSVR